MPVVEGARPETVTTRAEMLESHTTAGEHLTLPGQVQEALNVIETVALPARTRGATAARPRVIIDSGASNCLFATRDFEISGTFKPAAEKVDGIGGVTCDIVGHADQAIPVLVDGNTLFLRIPAVGVSPTCGVNLLSTGRRALRAMGVSYHSGPGPSHLSFHSHDTAYGLYREDGTQVDHTEHEGSRLELHVRNGLDILPTTDDFSAQEVNQAHGTDFPEVRAYYGGRKSIPTRATEDEPPLVRMHRQMSHAPWDACRAVLGMPAGSGEDPTCRTCVKMNMRQNPHTSDRADRAGPPFASIAVDIITMSAEGMGGEKYGIVFVCRSSGQTKGYAIKDRTEETLVTSLERYIQWVHHKTAGASKVFELHADNEFGRPESFCAALREHRVHLQLTAPHSSFMNPVVERMNQTVMGMVRCSMEEFALPRFLWPYAFEFNCDLVNDVPVQRLGTSGKPASPNSLLGLVRDVRTFAVFGCPTFVWQRKDQRDSKLAPRGQLGIFMGFAPDSKAVRVYLGGGIRGVITTRNFRMLEAQGEPLPEFIDAESPMDPLPDEISRAEIRPTPPASPASQAATLQVPDTARTDTSGKTPGSAVGDTDEPSEGGSDLDESAYLSAYTSLEVADTSSLPPLDPGLVLPHPTGPQHAVVVMGCCGRDIAGRGVKTFLESIGYTRVTFIRVSLEKPDSFDEWYFQADFFKFVDTYADQLRLCTLAYISPSCKWYSTLNNLQAGQRDRSSGTPDIPRAIKAASEVFKVWMIENVLGARPWMHGALELCGRMVGLPLLRHRLFLCSEDVPQPPHPDSLHAGCSFGTWVVHGKKKPEPLPQGAAQLFPYSGRWKRKYESATLMSGKHTGIQAFRVAFGLPAHSDYTYEDMAQGTPPPMVDKALRLLHQAHPHLLTVRKLTPVPTPVEGQGAKLPLEGSRTRRRMYAGGVAHSGPRPTFDPKLESPQGSLDSGVPEPSPSLALDTAEGATSAADLGEEDAPDAAEGDNGRQGEIIRMVEEPAPLPPRSRRPPTRFQARPSQRASPSYGSATIERWVDDDYLIHVAGGDPRWMSKSELEAAPSVQAPGLAEMEAEFRERGGQQVIVSKPLSSRPRPSYVGMLASAAIPDGSPPSGYLRESFADMAKRFQMEVACLADSAPPGREGILTYRQAMSSPNRDMYRAAVLDHFEKCFVQFDCFELTTQADVKAKGVAILPAKWVILMKYHEDNTVNKGKARYVIGGHRQPKGDFDVFSPTNQPASSRTVIAIAVQYRLVLFAYDVESAYFYGKALRDVYCHLPEGIYEEEERRIYCWRLKKAVPGLRDSGRAWWFTLRATMEKLGFIPLVTDPCVYRRGTPGEPDFIVVCVHVDDQLVAATQEAREKFHAELTSHYRVTFEEARHLLGAHIKRDPDTNVIAVSHERYIHAMLEKYGMQDLPTHDVPASSTIELVEHTLEEVEAAAAAHPGMPYTSVVPTLLYSERVCRPDISFAVHRLLQWLTRPGPSQYAALKYLVGYMRKTATYGIVFRPTQSPNTIYAYADASYNQDSDSRSYMGHVLFLNGGPIAWSATKCRLVGVSATELEYYSAKVCSSNIMWQRMLMQELGLTQSEPTPILEDNNGCIQLARNPLIVSRSKHIHLSYHALRQRQTHGHIILCKVGTKDQVADLLTKALPRQQFEILRAHMVADTVAIRRVTLK